MQTREFERERMCVCDRGRVFVCEREKVRGEERERMCVLLQNGFRKENGVRAQKKETV